MQLFKKAPPERKLIKKWTEKELVAMPTNEFVWIQMALKSRAFTLLTGQRAKRWEVIQNRQEPALEIWGVQ